MKVLLGILVTVLLGGCAASSLSDLDSQNSLGITKVASSSDAPSLTTSSIGAAAAVAPSSGAVHEASLVASAAGQSAVPVQITGSLAEAGKPNSAGYKIGPLDLIEVSVFKVPELSKSAQVSEAGTLNLPLVGEIEAAGRSPRELEHVLTKLLGAKYLRNPQVTVLVKEYNSQRVTIDGAVKKPGVFPMSGKLSLLQAIATAQGFTDSADETVVVFRQLNGKQAAVRYDLASIRDGTSNDPPLQAGDVVVAGTSALKQGFNSILKALPMAGVLTLL